MRDAFATEAELAKVVLAWLQADGWDCFQEVECVHVADIVAVKAGKVSVVETKLHMNLDLLYQAHRWLPYAHFVWAAAPPARRAYDAWSFAQVACRALGVGLLEVRPYTTSSGSLRPMVRARCEPQEQNHAGSKLLATLRPEHKTFAAAGSPTGHRWTPFRETERALAAYVLEHPGVLASDALKAIKHHWRGVSPVSRVVKLVEAGILKGVAVERDGRRVRLRPAPAADPRAEAEARLLAALAHEAPDNQVAELAARLDAIAGR